mgnify:CR=1 FL=1
MLSRAHKDWKGATGYVQDVILKQHLNLNTTQVYACGSTTMINAAKKVLTENSLPEHQFSSDAFVSSN